jgi:glycosyltransferase involved in cell wall biosynthesis
MRILYDHQIFSEQQYGGISRYFCELIKGIQQSENSAYLSSLFSDNVYLQEIERKSHIFPINVQFPKKNELIHRLNKLHSVSDMQLRSFDVVHPTNYDPYFIPYIKKKPFVMTFYDAIHERFSGKYKELKDVRRVIQHKKLITQKADKIIAISENTKHDIIQYYDVNPDKIHVVDLATSFGNVSVKQSDESKEKYILYVGKRDAYKNFPLFLQAVAKLIVDNDMMLYCAGGGSFTAAEIKLIAFYHLEDRVLHKPIDNISLQHMYASAQAFVFPSLYEGFGIPILEAFACGCPCVLSNASSFPEVAGDAAMYFDPTEAESMAKAIENVITDSILRKALISKGYDRLTKYSWSKTVADTIDVYRKCL